MTAYRYSILRKYLRQWRIEQSIYASRFGGRLLKLFKVSRKCLHGYSIDLDLSDYIQRTIYFDMYETVETQWVEDLLKPGMTMVDAGANVGYYTLLAASLVGPSGRVFAFEPSRRIMKKLHRVVVRNNLHQVRCVAAGLSDVVSEGYLYEPPSRCRNDDPSISPYTSGMKRSLARFTTLDTLVTVDNLTTIDLLKLDIEGAELRAVVGGRDILATGKVRYVMCELNEDLLTLAGAGSAEVAQLIEGFGYELVDRTGPDACYNVLYRLKAS